MRLRKRKQQHHATEIQLQMHVNRLIFQSHPSRFQVLQSVTKSQNDLIVQTKTQTSLDASGSMGKETPNKAEIQQLQYTTTGESPTQSNWVVIGYCMSKSHMAHDHV